MSLIQSARMNGHDPYAYLKDVLTRLPTHRASRAEELLPHHCLSNNHDHSQRSIWDHRVLTFNSFP